MNMKSWKTVAIIVCAAVGLLWFSHTTVADQKRFEIHPDVAVSGYQSDAARITDAYERLMDRYMDMVEKNISINAEKLDSIDRRLARIEKSLNIASEKPRRTK